MTTNAVDPPPETAAQRALATRLASECGLNGADSLRIARAYRDSTQADPGADAALVRHANTLMNWGIRPDALADWLLTPGLEHHKRLHHGLGYTADQFALVGPIYDQRETIDAHSDRSTNHLESWRLLLQTVPPDFLTLCIQAGARTDDEIRDWDHRRKTGDPHVMAELSVLRGDL